jgi:threonine/homoserine/homoserine lactone efflux protein
MLSDPAFTPSLVAALLVFSMVGSITPGPNNIMLMVSGVNFGIRRTVPQMTGIFFGVIATNTACDLGLGYLFTHFPVVRIALTVLGVAFTLWLAWRIATAGTRGGGSLAQPMPFWESLSFQAVNPKLWLVAVTTAALYVHPGHAWADMALIVTTLTLINIPTMLLWAGGGALLRQGLQKPGRIKAFNIGMGLLLAASVLLFLQS